MVPPVSRYRCEREIDVRLYLYWLKLHVLVFWYHLHHLRFGDPGCNISMYIHTQGGAVLWCYQAWHAREAKFGAGPVERGQQLPSNSAPYLVWKLQWIIQMATRNILTTRPAENAQSRTLLEEYQRLPVLEVR